MPEGAISWYTFRVMFRRFLLLMAMAFAGVASARLQVEVSPRSVYVGDAFTLSVSVNDDTVKSMEMAWEPEMSSPVGQNRSTMNINGQISSRMSYTLRVVEPGTYRLKGVTALLASGKTLTSNQPFTVEVKPLEEDTACSLTLTAEPEVLFPGDTVKLRLTFRAPALTLNEEKYLPFLQTDFFGRTSVRPPVLRFINTLSEDAPVQLAAQPSDSVTFEGDTAIYTQELTFKAIRTGSYTFPAPLVNDVRITADRKELRCFVKGNPLTLTIQGAPTEGRPAGFTGIIGSTFSALAKLDTLNAKVGDPVTLSLTFFSDGDASLFRAPELPEITGFRAVGDPKRESLEGGARFVYTLRPTQAGLLEIPPLSLAWFNRSTLAYEKLETALIPLRVRPSAQLALEATSAEASVPPALRATLGPSPSVAPWPFTWSPWSPSGDAFELERTQALSAFAQKPEDFVEATNGWLKRIASGDRSAEALLNATSCALMAHHPEIAERTLQLRTLLWGLDASAAQAQAMIDAQFNQPPPWTHRLFAWHFRWPFAVRFSLFCAALILAGVTFPFRKLRWITLVIFLIGLASVGVSAAQLLSDLPQSVEVRQ